jgi:hypothetical protein
MQSASPEFTFVGLSPKDTLDVFVRGKGREPEASITGPGAKFTFAPMSGEDWTRISMALVTERQDGQRRVIAAMAARGEDPATPLMVPDTREGAAKDALVPHESLTIGDMAIGTEPTYVRNMTRLQLEALALSLRAHEGLVDKQGVPLPCIIADGRATPETVALYALNRMLLQALWPFIRQVNELDDAAKKA